MATPCNAFQLSSNSNTLDSINVVNVTPSTASYTVYVRIKPLDVLNPSNTLCEEHFSVTGASITTIDNNKKHEMHQNTFKFAQVFLPTASQVEIFNAAIEPRLREFFDGTDSLIFSYGTSSSGKSHTVQGTPSDPGLIPRALRTIYESVLDKIDCEYKLCPYKSTQAVLLSKSDTILLKKEKRRIFKSLTPPSQDRGDVTISGMAANDMLASLGDTPVLPTCIKEDEICSLWVSFFEVYNEQVFDLLTFRQEQKLQPLVINMDPDDQLYYPSDLKHLPAESWEEAYDIYRFGKKNLHVASTLLNRKSSRSHCVFTVKMLIRPKADESSYYPPVSFSICDLAGSERMMAHCESKTGSSFKEMKNINNSLLALNKCFLILKRGNNTVLPPFRDSQFTKLIKKFLIGQGKLVMITTISQSPELLPQTQQILKMTSIAHTTKVVIKEPTPACHVLLKNTPKRRFSRSYQNSLPDRHRPYLAQIAEDHQDLERLAQLELKLKLDKEALLNENRVLRDEKNKALDDFAHLQAEYDSLKESHKLQAQHIQQLETRFSMAESSESGWYKKTLELAQELSDRNKANFVEKVQLQVDLSLARSNLKKVIQPIKEHFSIDSNDPYQIAKRAIFLFDDVKTAAAEEISELTEELSKCQAELATSVETVANLTAKLNQLEEELSSYRQSELAKVQAPKILPVDDTLSDMDENEYRCVRASRRLSYSGSLDDEEPYIPIRQVKTSTKKRRMKKASSNATVASLQSTNRFKGGSQRRSRRRLLLGDVDCLPDDFVSNDRVSPKVQLSPGSAMRTLRSTSSRK